MAYPGGAPVTIVGGSAGNASGGSAGTASNPLVVSSAESGVAKTDRSVTASTTSQQAASAKANRKRLFVQNLDAAINVHINLGGPATTGLGSIRLAPGASLELIGTSDSLNVIAVSGAPLVTVWEF